MKERTGSVQSADYNISPHISVSATFLSPYFFRLCRTAVPKSGVLVRFTSCPVHFLPCSLPALFASCPVHFLPCSLPALFPSCPVRFLPCSLPALFLLTVLRQTG
jgi:hypothetical protein